MSYSCPYCGSQVSCWSQIGRPLVPDEGFKQLTDRIAQLESAYARAYARVGRLEAALDDIASRTDYTRDDCGKRAADALGSAPEPPVSTLCAVCDQIKELHPSSHPWMARAPSTNSVSVGTSLETPAQVPCPCGYDGCRSYKNHLKGNEYCWRDRQAAGLAQETPCKHERAPGTERCKWCNLAMPLLSETKGDENV